MKALRYSFATAVLIVTLSYTPAVADGTNPVTREIDDLLNRYVAEQNFAGSVLVAKAGDILLERGYGLADVERNVPNTPDTKFMIGSTTKQFTAMLVTQLVEAGPNGGRRICRLCLFGFML